MPDPSTTRLALYKSKSDGSELVNYSQDIGQNWDKVDTAVGYQSCTSSTRPSSPYSGKPIFETDTSYRTFFSNGTSPASASWVEIPNGSASFNSTLRLASGKQINVNGSGSSATLAVVNAATTTDLLSARVTGDTQDRFEIETDGTLNWGAGASTAPDTNLFRSAANTLRTNDSLTVDLNLTVSGSAAITGATTVGGALTVTGNVNSAANLGMGAWTSWTPTWTTSSGAATPSYGNATVDCKYVRIGRTIIFRFDITFGSTTNFGTSPGTGDNWLFSLPVTPAAAAGSSICMMALRQSNAAALMARARIASTGTDMILSINSARVDAGAITNTGDVDSVSPWTWASSNELHAVGQYEAAS
ncbi:hypothetical protein [Streptomyces sp. NPDC008240]|uniref:hypothetical protein n=1 Tax=Streptomyces sp. NPDC008240 TaxID=3364822 RepID=UPI0036E05FA2